jgi:hypothetical protein
MARSESVRAGWAAMSSNLTLASSTSCLRMLGSAATARCSRLSPCSNGACIIASTFASK